MKTIKLGKTELNVPAIAVGCMRMDGKSKEEMNTFIHEALDMGLYYFDHADIYGGGVCETIFGEALKEDTSVKREDLFIQSKCGIKKGYYDLSKEYILESVDGILKRLNTEYLDMLLLHRPDALVEPEEVAKAFDILKNSGKVREFGVSNHNPLQIELLKKYVNVPIHVNQLQLSIPVSSMISAGMEVNMGSEGAVNRDGSVLDYCRLNDVTIQAWSPFQMPDWAGCFFGASRYKELNEKIDAIAKERNVSNTAVATAWILRHPAGMQVVSGTSNAKRLRDMIDGSQIELSREEWYALYLAAGHILP